MKTPRTSSSASSPRAHGANIGLPRATVQPARFAREQLADILASLHLLGEAGDGHTFRKVGGGRLTAAAEHRDAPVAGDGEEPRLEVVHPPARCAELAVGGQKGLLDRVLGFFERPEQMPAEREQRASMAIEQNLEGDLVALAELLDEPLVARPGEEGPEPKDAEGDRLRWGARQVLFAIGTFTRSLYQGLRSFSWKRSRPEGPRVQLFLPR
jgi:hypothetical protein